MTVLKEKTHPTPSTIALQMKINGKLMVEVPEEEVVVLVIRTVTKLWTLHLQLWLTTKLGR